MQSRIPARDSPLICGENPHAERNRRSRRGVTGVPYVDRGTEWVGPVRTECNPRRPRSHRKIEMNELPELTTTLLLAGLLILALAAIFVAQVVGRARAARDRVIEAPNSHYTSATVRDREDRRRWHAIDRTRIHEINVEEVDRLLEQIDAIGSNALRPSERIFLERMVELSAPPRRPNDGPLPA